MTRGRSIGVAAFAGAASWTAIEYALHRFAMHEMRGRGTASKKHLAHHADITYFGPAATKVASAAATAAVMYPFSSKVAGRQRAGAFTAGFITMYFGYEIAHRRTHTHPPRNRFGRWARRSHMHHHFGAPMRNYGVTTPMWDRLLGTYDDPGVVTIPRRMAPPWLLDSNGEVRPELAGDYIVKSGRVLDAASLERDRVDAFANIAPEV